jgi:hypothetical protein
MRKRREATVQKRMVVLVFVSAVVAQLALGGAVVQAANESRKRVSDIRRLDLKGRPVLLDERVRIDGYVTQYVEATAKTTAFYFLKDDWGGILRVRTSGPPPAVGKRYSVAGPVSYDPKTKDPYISEESRAELDLERAPAIDIPTPPAGTWTTAPSQTPVAVGGPVASPGSPSPRAEVTPAPPSSFPGSLLIFLGVVLVGVIVALVAVLARRRTRPRTSDFDLAAAGPFEAAPLPEQIIEGTTIKMHAPPPNTIKLMPGWFEVVSGDEVVKQIRFYKPKGDAQAETTFGRAAGRPYVHVQLKSMTVSARQAKIAFDGGQPNLTNLAAFDSNPTKVNGKELGLNEIIPLQDKDKVEMGEVVFEYHAS